MAYFAHAFGGVPRAAVYTDGRWMVNSIRAGFGFVVLGAVALASSPAWADREDRGGHEERGHMEVRHEGPGFHGEIGRFHEHDWGVWRGGHWQHVRHDGRLGWWWIAGGIWYFYPYPVYPYPNPYEPPVFVEPVPGAPPPPPPTPSNWYYCESARNYYPYVPSCAEGWRPVPANQTPAAPPPPR
jgi:hypothetical protein